MAIETFLLYLATWSVFAISPGPAVLFSMSQAARNGMRGAAAGTAGILLGHLVCFLLVAFGLAALLAGVNGAMTVIRIAGAIYLMYLGARMIFAKPHDVASLPVAAGRRAQGGIALQGLLVQLTNPKNLLFVLALLPQFIAADRALLPQLGIMFTVTVLIDAICLLAYAQIAARGARALKGSRVMMWVERTFGAALIFFGIRLLVSAK
jgi:homoserine/homoserine lactone efflux protein